MQVRCRGGAGSGYSNAHCFRPGVGGGKEGDREWKGGGKGRVKDRGRVSHARLGAYHANPHLAKVSKKIVNALVAGKQEWNACFGGCSCRGVHFARGGAPITVS